MKKAYRILAAALFGASVCGNLQAATVTLDATDRGWYQADGTHMPANLNYAVGDSFIFIDNLPEFRNFFVFDLSSIGELSFLRGCVYSIL